MAASAALPPAQEEVSRKQCPRCKSGRLHRSHRKTALDRILCAMGGEIRRCHDCRARQVWFGGVVLLLPTEGMHGGLASALLLGAAFLGSFLFIWWMISRFTELAG